ncbi:MAG: response regulator [Lachnospiraceae bacterium]|nr:response regulator [Lachnospiraceae bacterium]MBQ9608716.1 response regulator [Lachnospiraceae bacterium]
MKVICVDDEKLILDMVCAMCEKMSLVDDVKGFFDSKDAYNWISDNPVDLAILDIDMPDINV